jgi:UDP-glucose 4-epimerase
MRFLVTGGAGYVGSHCVAALCDRGHEVVVIDDLSRGHRAALLPGVELIEGRLSDPATLARALARGPFAAVFHFAALTLVGESMAAPLRYFSENLGEGLALLQAALDAGIRRFVFSSTANLFGAPAEMPITEETPLAPASPYGESKFMFERILAWAERIHGLRYAALRYFNAAGADPEGRLGEDHEPETHLIPLAIDAALGRRPPLTLFGTDYPTPDGTCIRDYIHVSDLATAHLAALEALEQGGSRAYNLGTGKGHSVREVIAAVERVSGRKVPVVEGARRPGDPAVLVASSARLERETGWRPRFSALDEIIATAYAWRLAHPDGYR